MKGGLTAKPCRGTWMQTRLTDEAEQFYLESELFNKESIML